MQLDRAARLKSFADLAAKNTLFVAHTLNLRPPIKVPHRRVLSVQCLTDAECIFILEMFPNRC